MGDIGSNPEKKVDDESSVDDAESGGGGEGEGAFGLARRSAAFPVTMAPLRILLVV